MATSRRRKSVRRNSRRSSLRRNGTIEGRLAEREQLEAKYEAALAEYVHVYRLIDMTAPSARVLQAAGALWDWYARNSELRDQGF
jgi:hypothetical protein